MIGINLIVKHAENFPENNAKNFAWKFITVTEKSSKNRNNFLRLWRQVFTQSQKSIQLRMNLPNIEDW